MNVIRPCAAVIPALVFISAVSAACCAQDLARTSKTIAAVLREPLPPEELSLSESAAEFSIAGPTFTYRVRKATGTIDAIRVVREGHTVIEAVGPADIQIDGFRLASKLNSAKPTVVSQNKGKIVLESAGILRNPEKDDSEADYTLRHTFFNDGVVVSEVKLTPRKDLLVEKAIVHRIATRGRFSVFDHKQRNRQGPTVRGGLPEPGASVHLDLLSSCLQVYGPSAGLAIFTDCGATYLSQPKLDSALLEVTGKEDGFTTLALSQYIIHVAPGDRPYLVKAGEPFTFRLGISVAPNKFPHPRTHDLRMFTWIGDGKNPYPTDEEITTVARLGFTLFQLHRAGTPGDPRPPAGEAARVVKKVHEAGMLFLWEENPDLLHVGAPGVVKLKAEGRWSLWQGFNYKGRYTDWMDPFCDTVATCLAAPNGLAEYRLANINRMMDQMPVDGLYLDDNAAYPTCKLWKEHGHPRPVYDCLIEHHEMNWRRRELMRSRCPHLVLVSHCSLHGLLPLICDFDAQLYGEGYAFGSLQDYWDKYSSLVMSIPSQGMIWPSAAQPHRCTTSVAYNLDLLTGGGQYTEIDWRVFFKKYPSAYTKGADDRELETTRFYNLAQYYFGMYESKPYYFAYNANLFATKTPQTYAAVYHNQIWNDWLIPVANMSGKSLDTAIMVHSPRSLGIVADKPYILFDVQRRNAVTLRGDKINQCLEKIRVPGENLRLFCLRSVTDDKPCHLWGGKRISEVWDAKTRKLTVKILGPAGLQETVFFAGAKHGIQKVIVAGAPADFTLDPAQGLAHGLVTFTADPLVIEMSCSSEGRNGLPERPFPPVALFKETP